MEVFYNKKRKLKNNKYRFFFAVDIDGLEIPFCIDAPVDNLDTYVKKHGIPPYYITLVKGWNYTATRIVMIGASILAAQNFIKDTIKTELHREIMKNKNKEVIQK